MPEHGRLSASACCPTIERASGGSSRTARDCDIIDLVMSAATRRGVVLAVACVIGTAGLMLAAIRPPKLQYQITTLPNGLTVVLSEDRSTPIVHAELWYHVGSKNEQPGLTGFAHLFEHLMFQGSKNLVPEQHASMISSIGGRSNAYTTEDVTVFWQTVPAHYLPMVLWMEADRMATLRIDETALGNEREVVKEERRMRVENQPFGRLSEIIYDHAYTVHPYKHPTIGSMADLEAASVEDVQRFYDTYYVPDNATLVLVGDFESATALDLVKQYLGRVPKAERPVPRDIPVEPPWERERRVTIEEDWPLPAVVIAHRIPHDGHPDSYPLHVASKILSDGQSSRIYRRLVYSDQVALAAFGQGDIIEDPNLFFAVAIVQPGRSPADAERALVEELERLQREPVDARELERAKNQFARDYILGRTSNRQKATHLAHAVVIHDDITTADGEFDIFMSMTEADLQRVARTYFTSENRLTLTIMPRGMSAGGDR